MKKEETILKNVFSSILSNEGITTPIDRIDVEGLRDEPGFHWSNPGLKSIRVTVGETELNFVVKRLGEHSKREVLIYRFLADYPKFPMPRLFHNIYDDEKNDYWFVTERCVGRSFSKSEDFWRECGLLLARIHAIFWEKTNSLPDLFNPPRESDRALRMVENLIAFIDGLSKQEIADLPEAIGPILDDLRVTLVDVDYERLPSEPPPVKCLIHKSFHPPEIMWREVDDGFLPLAVDWETARIGAPQEDFGVIGQLLSQGEEYLVRVLLDAYLNELSKWGVSLSFSSFMADVRREAILGQLSVAPWLVTEFLKRRDEKAFAEWSEWAAREIPCGLAYLRKGILDGDLYIQ